MFPHAPDPVLASKPGSALLIVAHGSTEGPDSSDSCFEQAQAIRDRGVFAEVHCAFWKEEPGFRTVGYAIESDEVYVVPHFISEGYFTQEVIPRELELTGRTTRVHGKTWHYCHPAGIHPHMADLLLRRAKEIAPEVEPLETSLLIVGHGTHLNARSAEAVRAQVSRLRQAGAPYREVLDAYLEQEPRLAQWDERCSSPSVIVVPFFMADGLHTVHDIPAILGMKNDPGAATGPWLACRPQPVRMRGRALYYSRAIGSDPAMAEIILDQVRDFDRSGAVQTHE